MLTSSSRPGLILHLGCVVALLTAACSDGPTGSIDPVEPGDEVTRILILTAPMAAVLGLPLPSQPIVELRDDANQVVRVAGVVIAASVSTGTLSGTTSVETNAQGRASFSDLIIEGDAGQVELRFSCCGLAPVTRSLSLSVREATIQRLNPEVIVGYAGDTLMPGPKVLLKDEWKQPKAGATVSWTFDSASALPAISVTTSADGVAALPFFQFGDLPSATHVTAIDVGTGKSVDYTLTGTVRGEAYADRTFTLFRAGEVAILPRVAVYDESTDPVSGALVRYRIASGDGVLSLTEAYTGDDGWTEPVTLSNSGQDSIVIEMIAVGYSEHPIVRTVRPVVPPLSFEYAGPCDHGCPTAFDFSWPLTGDPVWGMDAHFQIRVRDARGVIPGYAITLARDAEAPYLFEGESGFDLPISEANPLITDADGIAWLGWRLPEIAGSYSITMSGPMIDAPWTYTATVE